MSNTTQYDMQDPRKQYPVPSIPEQTQSEPGLDATLEPPADHGLATYRGAGRLEGRKALITGGDSGIGRAVAIAYAREGADVAVHYLPSEKADAESLAEELSDTGRTIALLSADLSDEDQARQLPHRAAKALEGLDIIVNNAGKQVFQENLTDITTQQLQETFTVNILAMFWICQEAVEYLRPGSAIVNSTSIQASQPSAGLLDYASTKGAISTFTMGLAQMLTPEGIRVNAVAPGPIWTPLQPSHGQPQEKLVQFGQDTPLGRPGQPAELASAYVFLASQEASYVSGQILGVTGGRIL